MKHEYFRQIFEKKLNQISWKILPVGAELLDTDGQTDRKKQIVAFRNFAKTRKYRYSLSHLYIYWRVAQT
jgi:hypothetical protein